MRFVPNWLHAQLLSFKWYRAKCGIPEWSGKLSDITSEVLRLAHERMDFTTSLNREYEAGAFDHLKTLTIRKPVQFTHSVSGD